MAGPPVAGEGERSVLLFIHGDVIRSFEPDDVIAFDVVFVVTPGGRFLEQGQAHFLNGRAQSVDVFDLSFDGCEMTHGFSFRWFVLEKIEYRVILAASMKGRYKKALLILFGIGTVALLSTVLLSSRDRLFRGKPESERIKQLSYQD